ncbi:MAG: hypothetical protein ACRYG8_51695, partial [Janthinobacterium lividum]
PCEARHTMPLDALHQPDATFLADGVVTLTVDGRARSVRMGGQPVRAFAPGWRAGALSRLFAPMLLLEFQSATGETGLWLLDRELNHLHASIEGLPDATRQAIVSVVRPILDWIVNDRLRDGQPEPVVAFLSLLPGIRHSLETLCRDEADAFPLPELDERQRDLAPGLAPVGLDLPILHRDSSDTLTIGQTGLMVRHGDVPAVLNPGWTARRASVLAFPTLILELEHESGHHAVWYLDHEGRFIGHNACTMQPELRAMLSQSMRPLFDGLWRTLLLNRDVDLTDLPIRFLGLAEVVRIDLMALALLTRPDFGLPVETAVWVLDDVLPRNLGYVLRTGTGVVALDPEALRTACLQSLQQSFVEQMQDGETSWPSPVDGVPVHTTLQPLYFDNLCFAYQLYDARHDLTFHVVALEWHFRTFGIYFPSADLFVAADPGSATRMSHYCLDFVAVLLRHLSVYGQSIARGLARSRAGIGPLVQAFRGEPALHIGHYLWQDLAGLDWLTRRVAPDRLPHCLVFDSRLQAEMYGPIDEIYPELDGRVIRRDGPFENSIRTFYETGTRVMKITAMTIPASVGAHVMDAIDRSPSWRADLDDTTQIAPGTPVVVLGLRVGNRTLEDQAGFFARVVTNIAAACSGAHPVIVLDGHNSAGEGRTYRSVADDRPGALSFVDTERAIAASLAEHCAVLGIRLVDLIGQPVARSLIWCRRAQFFVAPWGAALAKYRWICNTPGLVMTGHWNMTHRGDLDIYNTPHIVDAPSELLFVPAEHVEDIELPGEAPDRANFRVDEATMFALVRRFLADYPG